MITENLSTLKIHKLTQAQYDRELAAGRIDQNALYLTPDEQTSEQFGDVVRYDANQYLTEAQKAQARHNIGAVEINDIYDNGLREFYYTWDGTTDSRDTFTVNDDGNTESFYFCKVSDNVPSRSVVRNFNGALITDSDGEVTYRNNGGANAVNSYADESHNIYFHEFENGYMIRGLGVIGAIIFVETAGLCNYDTYTFTAPTSGVYFPFNLDGSNRYISDLALSTSLKSGIYLNSVAGNKKFTVKVTTDGALKTVDEDNTTVEMATKDYVDEKIASTGGNGNGLTSVGWNDIADKPFHDSDNVVAELSGTFGSTDANAMVPDASAKTLIVGNTYTVLWNGAEYIAECAIADGVPAVGNIELMSGVGDNGMPFVIARDANGVVVGTPCWVVVSTTGAVGEAYTAIITYKQECLDNKYLSILDYTPPVVTELLPVTQFDNFYLSSDFGVFVQNGSEDYTLVVGNEYDVVWDDDTYRCVAQDISAVMPGSIGLGNVAALAPGYIGNNEPFIIALIVGSGNALYASLRDTAPNGSHRVGISQTDGKAVYKIKSEYMPVAVTAEDNGKILEVVNGTWTAVTIADSSVKTYIDEYIASALEGEF